MSASAYERILTKYDWAKKHVRDFEAAVDVFRADNPHSIRYLHDEGTAEIVYYVESVPVIPNSLRLMLGDAIHNLRSTLDHVACALVIAADPAALCEYTGFPIFDSSEAFRTMSRGKVPGLGQQALKNIDILQPYKGGLGHALWQLHRLDIINKHRLLLTVSTVNTARSATPREKLAGKRDVVVVPAAPFFSQLMFAATVPAVRAMEAADELARFPASEEYENMGFVFDVAINEPDILEGMPTFLFLRGTSSNVFRIIQEAERWM
jgi:hypothetical protein